jgi:hypothetical protein
MTIIEINVFRELLPDDLSTNAIAAGTQESAGNVSAVLTGKKAHPILRRKIINHICKVLRRKLFDERFEQSVIEAREKQ